MNDVIPIYQIVFYVFATILVLASMTVIFSKNPVRAALFLVLAFFASSVLWMMLKAEFLSLVLIFVYVGAVMTLFLFVVMMLNIDIVPMREGFVRYAPIALIVSCVMIGFMLMVLGPHHLSLGQHSLPVVGENYSNTKALGELLFTQYLYPFEIAAVILLVAIVSAISLGFFGRRSNTKAQRIRDQLKANKTSRLRIIDMEIKK